VMMNFWGV